MRDGQALETETMKATPVIMATTDAIAAASRPRRRRRRAASATAAAAATAIALVGWLVVAVSSGGGLATAAGEAGLSLPKVGHPSPWARRPLSLPPLPPANSCTPRSIETFPPDLFSLAEKKRGAILLHAAAAFWLLAGLAIVCDDYFVASLEILCDVLHLKPDVAGATFMAAGSSAPELFASVIGVFFTESDVGVSTIVGSAVFNLLFIVSLCGLLATQTIFLSWWPLFRDCSYYSLSVIALVLVIYNEEVHWYESAAFLLLYAMYIVVMYFNESIDQWIATRWPSLATGGNQRMHEAAAGAKGNGHSNVVVIATAKGVVAYTQLQMQPDKEDEPQEESEDAEAPQPPTEKSAAMPPGNGLSASAEPTQMTEVDLQQNCLTIEVASSYESPLTFPAGLCKQAYWCITLPWTLAFMLTIPDCRRPGRWRSVFLITLINSILWIGGMSYLLVWMVCAVGDTLGIPDTVMGLTLLAAGTSVPDALASVFVVRDGLGDMAVSNTVGSNVFDILIGLGLPWFIGTAVRGLPDGVVRINSAGLIYSSVVLLSTVVLLFAAVYANKMRLDKRLGVACMLMYAVFLTVSVLFETNVFALLNPPPCPRTQN